MSDNVTIETEGTTINEPAEAEAFSFLSQGTTVMLITHDGVLVPGPGLSQDEATRKMASILVAQFSANYETTLGRYRAALEEIRDVAKVSEGVEFYAMIAEKALTGED